MYNILQSKFQLKSANINFLKWKFGDANAFEKISLLWYLLFNQIHACKYFTVVCCLLDLFLLAILGF